MFFFLYRQDTLPAQQPKNDMRKTINDKRRVADQKERDPFDNESKRDHCNVSKLEKFCSVGVQRKIR